MINEVLREDLNKLFLYIFFNDLPQIKKVKSNKPNVFYQSNSYPLHDGKIFNLANLTLFNYAIWRTKDWKEDFIPFAKKREVETKKVLEFWHSENLLNETPSTFNYNEYWNYFYSEDPEEKDFTNGEPNDFFVNKGIKEIDVMLYNRAECFDFKAVRNLMKRGANPNVDFYEEDYQQDTIMNRISIESANLSTQVIPLFISFEKLKYNQNFKLKFMFSDLIGYAAHEEMYKILKTTQPDKWMMENM
ncbi:MAG TPA: hypothetical protein VK027_07040 [Chitinophagaceae bacterium]|nr:hypothetical protein [Chitinophagaceae bacterium]